MDLHEAFVAQRDEIKSQVLNAAENMSLHTTLKVLDNGALILRQPNAAVTLTPSQAKELMARIAADVRA